MITSLILLPKDLHDFSLVNAGLTFKLVLVYGKIWSGNQQAGCHKTLDCLILSHVDIFIHSTNIHGTHCSVDGPEGRERMSSQLRSPGL